MSLTFEIRGVLITQAQHQVEIDESQYLNTKSLFSFETYKSILLAQFMKHYSSLISVLRDQVFQLNL